MTRKTCILILNLCAFSKTKSTLTFKETKITSHYDTQKSSSDTAHDLNCHFARICNELPSLDLCALPSYLPALPPPIIARQEVYNKLRKLNATKSGHPTDVPIRLLKEFAYEISEPLTTIFNECLRGGHFPSNWKTASVCHRF